MFHGDFRDRNIFMQYKEPAWRQKVRHNGAEYMIDTGGYEIKLGDFGLTGDIIPGTSSFIMRDYEFIENIYCQRNIWDITISNPTFFSKIVEFLRKEFMLDFYQMISKYRKSGQTIKESRRNFWFSQHRLSKSSLYYYELPKELIRKYIENIWNPYIGIDPYEDTVDIVLV